VSRLTGEQLEANPTDMSKPTDRQLDVLRFIADYIESHRFAPSIREICDAIGVSGNNTVAGPGGHLDLLERKGLIGRRAGVPRALWITDAGAASMQ